MGLFKRSARQQIQKEIVLGILYLLSEREKGEIPLHLLKECIIKLQETSQEYFTNTSKKYFYSLELESLLNRLCFWNYAFLHKYNTSAPPKRYLVLTPLGKTIGKMSYNRLKESGILNLENVVDNILRGEQIYIKN